MNNIWFLKLTPTHNPNGISIFIFSAVFAQLTTDILYNGPPFAPQNCPFHPLWIPSNTWFLGSA